jgi:hypothetical protein
MTSATFQTLEVAYPYHRAKQRVNNGKRQPPGAQQITYYVHSGNPNNPNLADVTRT